MAGRSAILKVDIVSDARGATKGIDETSSKFGKMGQNVKRVAAVAGVAVAGLALKFGKDSVDAFVEAEASHKKLEDAVARFPKLADTSVASLDKLNSSLAKKTKFDDDATSSGQAVLAGFDVTGKQLRELTPLMQDYAAKTGKDLPASAAVLGKALNGSTTALKKIGIDYKSTGDKTKDYANITQLLRDKVGGFAESEGKTAAGQAEILKNQFGEVQETVGSKLVPILTKLAGVLLTVIEFVQTNSSVIGPLVAILGTLVAVVFTIIQVQKAWTAVQAALNFVMSANPIALVVIAVAALVAGVILAYKHSETFRNIVAGAFAAVKSAAQAMWDLLKAAFAGIGNAFDAVRDRISTIVGSVVGFFGALPGRLVVAAGDVFGWLRDKVIAVRDWISDRVSNIVGFYAALPGRLASAAAGLLDAYFDKVRALRDYVSGVVADIVGFFRDLPGKIASQVSRIHLPDLNPFSANVVAMVAAPGAGVGGLVAPGLGLARAGLATAAAGSGGFLTSSRAGTSAAVVPVYNDNRTIRVEGALDPVAVARQLKDILHLEDVRNSRGWAS